METTKNAIAWFEIPVIDFERAKIFYQQIYHYGGIVYHFNTRNGANIYT